MPIHECASVIPPGQAQGRGGEGALGIVVFLEERR